jgi:nucleoid-associated protein YgaU
MLWAAVALCGWLGLGSLLAVGATLPGTFGAICADLARWLTPRLLRQTMAAAIGTTVATLSLPMAAAHGAGIVRDAGAAGVGDLPPQPGPPRAPQPAPPQAPAEPGPGFGPTRRALDLVSGPPTAANVAPTAQTRGSAPDPGWAPSPPVRIVQADESRLVASPPRPSVSPDAAVTVHRGDTLWHIAARHLGPGASDAEIALEWPRWYAANSQLIGSDPDRLLPGQQLDPPVPDGSR